MGDLGLIPGLGRSSGKFTPDGEVQYLEMAGISRDGYGLLSPSIYTLPSPVGEGAGVRLLLGIVPDKLPTQTNFEMGWAHNYSLPREISLAADGSLVQKPYSGLSAMRTETLKATLIVPATYPETTHAASNGLEGTV